MWCQLFVIDCAGRATDVAFGLCFYAAHKSPRETTDLECRLGGRSGAFGFRISPLLITRLLTAYSATNRDRTYLRVARLVTDIPPADVRGFGAGLFAFRLRHL
jgi:hypothetical protein